MRIPAEAAHAIVELWDRTAISTLAAMRPHLDRHGAVRMDFLDGVLPVVGEVDIPLGIEGGLVAVQLHSLELTYETLIFTAQATGPFPVGPGGRIEGEHCTRPIRPATAVGGKEVDAAVLVHRN
jgi:hypothetical protein